MLYIWVSAYMHYILFIIHMHYALFKSMAMNSYVPLWALQILKIFTAQEGLGFFFFCPLGNKLVSGVCLNFLWSMLGTGWWSSDPVLCGSTESSLCSITGVSCCQVQGHTSNWIWNQKEFPPKWDWQGKYILGYLENVSCLLWLAKVLMILWFFLCISFEF